MEAISDTTLDNEMAQEAGLSSSSTSHGQNRMASSMPKLRVTYSVESSESDEDDIDMDVVAAGTPDLSSSLSSMPMKAALNSGSIARSTTENEFLFLLLLCYSP